MAWVACRTLKPGAQQHSHLRPLSATLLINRINHRLGYRRQLHHFVNCAPQACGIEANPALCLERITSHLIEDFNGNRIVIDCTESPAVADYYTRWLTLGAHTPLHCHTTPLNHATILRDYTILLYY